MILPGIDNFRDLTTGLTPAAEHMLQVVPPDVVAIGSLVSVNKRRKQVKSTSHQKMPSQKKWDTNFS